MTSTAKLELGKAETTILGLTIGEASLKDVEAKLGKASPLPRREHADSSICYVAPSDGTVLVFSAGSMGGWRDITEFALWSREAAFPQRSKCTPSEKVSRRLSTDSGMRLGLTGGELSSLLGQAKKTERTKISYEFSCSRKMSGEEVTGFRLANNWDVSKDPYVDVSSWIEATFIRSRVSRISVTKIESY